mmetsp:Transcript_25704/g.57617  ORF Transcript_25704/g.57617 Transcript_25704/m.57617 type:complete len:106 (+) Transcript_25704:2944-3261(+)
MVCLCGSFILSLAELNTEAPLPPLPPGGLLFYSSSVDVVSSMYSFALSVVNTNSRVIVRPNHRTRRNASVHVKPMPMFDVKFLTRESWRASYLSEGCSHRCSKHQ